MHGWRHAAAGWMLTWQSRRGSRRVVHRHAVLNRAGSRFAGLDSRVLEIPFVQHSLAYAWLAEAMESGAGDRVPCAAFGDLGRFRRANWDWPAWKNRRPYEHHHWRREEERIEEKPRVPARGGRTEPEGLSKTVGAAKRAVAVKAVRIRSNVAAPIPSGLKILVVHSVVVGIAGNVIGS